MLVNDTATSTMASGPSSKSLAPRAGRGDALCPPIRRDAPLQSALASQSENEGGHLPAFATLKNRNSYSTLARVSPRRTRHK